MLKEGMVIEGPFWPEPIEIKKIEKRINHMRIIGTTIYSNITHDQLIPIKEIDKLKISEFVLDFSAPGIDVFLSLEALRYKFASLFDPFLAMNASKIDPLPFQLEAVYCNVLKLPKIRFMIADDPGAGKTIMAGLIIKELKLRRIASRILIVTPGHLKDQWTRELKEKFQEHFTIVDRGFVGAYRAESPWEAENQVITSIDFAKQDDIANSLKSVNWDLVIVDEAHKMAAYKYGKDTQRTSRYRLGEILSKTANNLLFLTATPHKGDPENYRLLLDLLVPGFFAKTEMITEARENKDNPLFIRRLKEQMKDFNGEPIFKKRFVQTAQFHLSDIEMDLYEELSEYVISQYNKAMLDNGKRRNVAFALLILQRRMASSTCALLKSLKRRKEKLQAILENPELLKKSFLVDIKDMEDYTEKERWEQELQWETSTVSENLGELEAEILSINKLIGLSEFILDSGEETKLSKLKEIMKDLKDNKILIFSESKDTVNYLVSKISSWGYSVNFIHGDLSMDERVNAENIFENETQVMVATEAAGEGINLQFCHLMINYDIPWNPNRLEQRMGRIHRYGQKHDVDIFNLVADNTREGKVLTRILEKLDKIRDAIGSDKVFDIIGEIFPGKDFYRMVTDAVAGIRSVNEIIEADILDENHMEDLIENVMDESLASNMDYNAMLNLKERSTELKLVPEYLEEFFKKAFTKAGGKIKIRKDNSITINSVPQDIRRMKEEPEFRHKYGVINRSYPRLTFDKEFSSDYEFISFGHPLFEAVIKWVELNYLDELQKGAVFKDPSGTYDGVLWFFEGEVLDGKGDTAGKKLFAVYDNNKELKEINPSILWDIVPVDETSSIKKETERENAEEYAISCIEKYMEELSKERSRQSQVKRKYGLKSLEYFIGELDESLVDLYMRLADGEKVDLPIRNAEERKKTYEIEFQKLKKEISLEENLLASMPKFIGAILVKPECLDEMVTNKEIEMIGMEVSMEYEKSQGRIPEDVSNEYLGFDIRSKGNETRYIEVKARKDEGIVALTTNEWMKAKRFGDQYWLYVVANAVTNPVLYMIQNPADSVEITQKVEVVFIVPPKEYKKGEMVANG